jgi:hypothetical protein
MPRPGAGHRPSALFSRKSPKFSDTTSDGKSIIASAPNGALAQCAAKAQLRASLIRIEHPLRMFGWACDLKLAAVLFTKSQAAMRGPACTP